MKLVELAASVKWAFGLIVDDTEVTVQAVAAARQYAGWGTIQSLAGDGAAALSDNTELTNGEWALIKPLFMLYVERENARALEASRGNGVDVFGRTVSEIAPEITQYESIDLPRLSFSCLPESI